MPMIKPSRSDEVVDPQQQQQITKEVQAQFESMAPKRPDKPNRSEPDPDASAAYQAHSDPIPELLKLISLKSNHNHQGGLSMEEKEWVAQEEFVETQYYKQLESIDKQHHTTGSGFIKTGKEEVDRNDEKYELFENGVERHLGGVSRYRSNPATNDWTPNIIDAVDRVECISAKPSRSG